MALIIRFCMAGFMFLIYLLLWGLGGWVNLNCVCEIKGALYLGWNLHSDVLWHYPQVGFAQTIYKQEHNHFVNIQTHMQYYYSMHPGCP